MKKLILRLLITTVAVFTIFYIVPGMVFTGGIIEFGKIVGALFVAGLLLKPIVKIISLPIEVATLGFVGVFTDTIVLWLLSRFVDGFTVTSFWFSGIRQGPFLIAPIEIPAVLTLLIAAAMLGFVGTVLYWLTK